MAKVDPRDFLLNTDYEMDKIIYAKDFTWTVSSATYLDVAHDLAVAPLVFGIWSYNADFSDPRMLGEYDDPWGNQNQVSAMGYRHKIRFGLETNSGQVTFYAKVFAFEPNSQPDWATESWIHKALPKTSGLAKQFIINTDYNYLKLIWSGRKELAIGGWSHEHNLGYVPQVLSWDIWQDIDNDDVGYEYESSFSYSDDYKSGLMVDTHEIHHYSAMFPLNSEVRIYGDEA